MSVPNWFQNLSFPLLREVTDYIMLYETAGIISMAKLFPNLSVIRGNHLFKVSKSKFVYKRGEKEIVSRRKYFHELIYRWFSHHWVLMDKINRIF